MTKTKIKIASYLEGTLECAQVLTLCQVSLLLGT